MLKLKNVKINGEELTIPDVKIGDKIDVSFDDNYDTDFAEWLYEYKGDLIVTEVDEDAGMIWLKDCEYGIDMSIISNIITTNEKE